MRIKNIILDKKKEGFLDFDFYFGLFKKCSKIWFCTSKSEVSPYFCPFIIYIDKNDPFFGPLFLENCPFLKCNSYGCKFGDIRISIDYSC